MTDQSKDNHWDDLVSDLGAEPRPDAVEQPATVAPESTGETPPDFDAVPSQAAMSQPPAAGWDDLASDFGISVPPAQSRKIAPDIEVAPVETESGTQADEQESAAGGDQRQSSAADRSTDLTDRPSRSERPRRRRGRPDRPADESTDTQQENFSLDVDHIESAVDFEPAEEIEFAEEIVEVEETVADDDEAAGPSDRPRRRRRRRGRRGARRPDDRAADKDAAGSDTEERLADEPDEDSDDLDDSDRRSARSSPGTKTKHRNIPTWEESVGVVVAANLESRAKAAKTAGRGRGRGSRGRGRPGRGNSDPK